MKSVSQLRTIVESAVVRAAAYLIEQFNEGVVPTVEVKPDASLVMSFDLDCERLILEVLSNHLPILSEENPESHSILETKESYFLIDPLDGTTSCKRFLGKRGGEVGYGPLVGCVLDKKLTIASFFNAPTRKLYTAVLGQGVYVVDLENPSLETLPEINKRTKLKAKPCSNLSGAGALFLLGKLGESKVAQFLKDNDLVENIYRFGGFANDCTRLAESCEQLSIQFAVKPWDYTAALIAFEAGLDVTLDPLGKRVNFLDWNISANNPLIISEPRITSKLFGLISDL